MKSPSTRKPRASRQLKRSDDDYVYIMNSTGGSVFKEFLPDHDKSDLVVTRLKRGERLTPEEMADFPLEMGITRPKSGGVPEIICWSTGPHIVCPQFRDWLEELEPGQVTFHPIRLRSQPIKGVSDHGTYYLIVRPPVIDALIVEGTVFSGGVGPAEIRPDGQFFLSGLRDAPCYINRKAVEGHHFWFLKGGNEFMFSAELLRRYRAHKFRGLHMSKSCILK